MGINGGLIMAVDDNCCCDQEHMTRRELDVIALVAVGYSNAQIAWRIGLSRHTVATHVTTAMRRVGARNRAELVARCYAIDFLVVGT
jgi:DNA-binding CsgD family transcriptional regulator